MEDKKELVKSILSLVNTQPPEFWNKEGNSLHLVEKSVIAWLQGENEIAFGEYIYTVKIEILRALLILKNECADEIIVSQATELINKLNFLNDAAMQAQDPNKCVTFFRNSPYAYEAYGNEAEMVSKVFENYPLIEYEIKNHVIMTVAFPNHLFPVAKKALEDIGYEVTVNDEHSDVLLNI